MAYCSNCTLEIDNISSTMYKTISLTILNFLKLDPKSGP